MKCKECRKLFASEEHLQIHADKHHGAERRRCADCNGKEVKNLAEHRRNVHRADSRAGCKNLRPAPCGECGKMFSTAYAAKYHFNVSRLSQSQPHSCFTERRAEQNYSYLSQGQDSFCLSRCKL